jgi:hypothetical protein
MRRPHREQQQVRLVLAVFHDAEAALSALRIATTTLVSGWRNRHRVIRALVQLQRVPSR